MRPPHLPVTAIPLMPTRRVAPEVLLGNRQIGFACDIWSMGVVLWEVSVVGGSGLDLV